MCIEENSKKSCTAPRHTSDKDKRCVSVVCKLKVPSFVVCDNKALDIFVLQEEKARQNGWQKKSVTSEGE